jgi:hypothetical protein
MNNNENTSAEMINRKENRRRLGKATTQYFESLSPAESAEEQSLAQSLSQASAKVNFDENTEE